jgi:hypothetical protein
MSRIPPATSGSGKNALGQEAFGSKVPDTPVMESPATSVIDMTSAAAGTSTTAASEAEKAGTSVPHATEGEGGDRGTSDPQEVPRPRGIIDEGMEAVNNEDRCLYAGTPWEVEVVTDREDLERFKDTARTIGTVLLVRTLAELLWFLLELLEYREVLRPLLFHV